MGSAEGGLLETTYAYDLSTINFAISLLSLLYVYTIIALVNNYLCDCIIFLCGVLGA